MGCSASSPGGVGGLYHLPNDEDDFPRWSPTSVVDAPLQSGSRSDNAARNSEEGRRCGGDGGTRSGAATPQQQQRALPCGRSLLASMACQAAGNGRSPERRPLRQPLHDVNSLHNECGRHTATTTTKQPPPREFLNQSLDLDFNNRAFSNRQWLVLPEHQYDMNSLHPALLPFLGSMYWTAASPLPVPAASSLQLHGRRKVNVGVRLLPRGSDQTLCALPEAEGEQTQQLVPSLITSSATEECSLNEAEDEQNIGQSPPMEMELPPASTTSITRFGIQHHAAQHKACVTQSRADKLLPSLHSTNEWESISVASSHDDHSREEAEEDGEDDGGGLMNHYSPTQRSVDVSCELLDYSALEESYLNESYTLGHQQSQQSPRRLFDADEDTENNASWKSEQETTWDRVSCGEAGATIPARRSKNKITRQHPPRHGRTSSTANFRSILCMAPGTGFAATIVEEDAPSSVASGGSHTTTAASSPSITTFHGRWGSRRERHVSTLPSPTVGRPIHLRVTESGLADKGGHSAGHDSRIGRTFTGHSGSTGGTSPGGTSPGGTSPGGDFCSYDPYFSTGKYTIALPNGRPYGNGLVMRMGWQFMILEDREGAVLAVIKSRLTERPSTVVYSTKKRFGGQVASGHRVTRQRTPQGAVRGEHGGIGSSCGTKQKRGAAVMDWNGDGTFTEGSEALYPWALISKGGRTMGDECAVHLVDDASSSSSSAGVIFHSRASFQGRHGFEQELHTHTVVSRTATAVTTAGTRSGGGSSTSLEEVEPAPCCVIVRDPSNLDVVDLTVAPGIDPLLMICYLASHSKMDVEPLMSSGLF